MHFTIVTGCAGVPSSYEATRQAPTPTGYVRVDVYQRTLYRLLKFVELNIGQEVRTLYGLLLKMQVEEI